MNVIKPELEHCPSKWTQAPLSELYEFKNGVNADRRAYGQGVPFINVLEPITYSHLKGSEITGRVDLPKSSIAAYAVRHGDLVFNRTSEVSNEVGLAAAYLGTECVVFGGFVIRARPVSPTIDSSFAAYAMRAPNVRAQIIAMGQGAVRANIGQENLGRVELKFPQLSEQLAIATALMDADALIASLEQLLTKKRYIKQGAMQELFKPARLHSRTVKLEQISSFITKGATPTTYGFGWESDGIVFLRSECVSTHGLDLTQSMFISEKAHTALRRSAVAVGDLLMTITGNVGRVARSTVDCNINQHIARIRITDPEINSDFVYHQLARDEVREELESITTGQAYPQLSLKQVRERTVQIPQRSEQDRIAAALSDMDEEIMLVESRLIKARALKQAMAQALLTGRIRLAMSPQERAVPVPLFRGRSALGNGPARTKELTI